MKNNRLIAVLSIIISVVYGVVLNMDMYTDRAMMPNGEMREWHRSPVTRLYIADTPIFLYLQIAFTAVSIIAGILVLLGVRKDIVKKVHLVSTIAAAVMFIIILIVTSNVHAKYA